MTRSRMRHLLRPWNPEQRGLEGKTWDPFVPKLIETSWQPLIGETMGSCRQISKTYNFSPVRPPGSFESRAFVLSHLRIAPSKRGA